MEKYKGLEFETFTKNDVDILTPVMKRAFDEDSRRHLNEPEGGPDGYDNGDFLRKYALNPKSQAYRISKDGRPVGAVIVWINPNGINFLGNIFIDPELQDKGLGTVVWEYIEKKYPETVEWRTETPGFSKRNHNFYVNKCGFSIVRIENPGDKYEESYQMQKVMKR
ncbi:MAG TPA: GNAT family N-acetyltransferase [Clostridia bacterium]|nr:GNAT family N-acetyltransferase [Clostridia bacterium]